MILAAAAAIFIALVSFVRRDPVRRVPIELSAFSLWQEASAAEAKLFAGDEVAHLVNEIVVTPVSDPTLARLRWFPLVSLEPTGKPRYDQLTLPAEVGKGYTVEDRSWYDPATGRFARTLTVGDRAISANSYDGKSVYTLEVPPTGASHLVKRPVAKDFRPPHSPAEFLGIAASLPNGLDLKDQTLVREVGKVTLADGAEGRVVKLGFPQGGPKGSDDAYYQFTIRTRDAAIEKMEMHRPGAGAPGDPANQGRKGPGAEHRLGPRRDRETGRERPCQARADGPPGHGRSQRLHRADGEKGRLFDLPLLESPVVGRRTSGHGHPRHCQSAAPHVRHQLPGRRRAPRGAHSVVQLQQDARSHSQD